MMLDPKNCFGMLPNGGILEDRIRLETESEAHHVQYSLDEIKDAYRNGGSRNKR